MGRRLHLGKVLGEVRKGKKRKEKKGICAHVTKILYMFFTNPEPIFLFLLSRSSSTPHSSPQAIPCKQQGSAKDKLLHHPFSTNPAFPPR